jgi:hypothetical protein
MDGHRRYIFHLCTLSHTPPGFPAKEGISLRISEADR